MPSNETELYFTAAEMVPYTAPLAKAVKLISQIYEFGKTSRTDRAIALLQQEVARIKAELAHINQRLDRLEQRLVGVENRQRVRTLTEISIELESLAFRLSTDPPAAIANEAGLRSDVFLTDADLWLWSDLKTIVSRDDAGNEQRRQELADPDFKSFPALSVYSFALATYATAIDLEARGNREVVQRRHGTRLRRHIEHVSVRPDWKDRPSDQAQAPATLPEQIRSRLTCYPVAQHKYALNGVCRFTIVCKDVINRRSTSPNEVVLDMPAGDNVSCTAPENVGWAEEQALEAGDDGLRVLTAVERMLRQLEMSGGFGQQFIGQFGASSKLQQEFAVRAHLAVGEGFLGGFPTFYETTQGIDLYGGTVFLTAAAGERRDIPLAELPNVSLDNMNDAMFAELMRATNAYASQHGFVGGFPTGFWGDSGDGKRCTAILLRHDAAEWRDVYLTDLGGPDLGDVPARFRKTHDYAVADGYAGGFPNLFHAHVGGGPFSTQREGMVCGTLFVKPGFGEWRNVFLFRGPR